MSNNSALLQQAKTTEVGVDHSEAQKGGGKRIPEEGKCPARLVGYIELGTHPQPAYKGQAKDPVMEVQLVFECFGKNNMDEIEVDGKKKTVGRIIRPLPMTMKLHEKAKFYKMFKDMDYDRGLDHMSKMLNDVFRLTISHGTAKSGNKYAQIDAIESPLIEKVDQDTGDVIGHTDISDKVPPASYDLQLFIVEKPTFEQWNSIEIEGTYTKKLKDDDGKETGEEEEVSKNFIQEKIMASLDWEGSAMQVLLADLGEEESEEEEKPKKKKAASTKKSAKTAEKKSEEDAPKEQDTASDATESPSEEEDTDALMAELGLD